MKYRLNIVDIVRVFDDLTGEKLVLSLLKGFLADATAMAEIISAINGYKVNVHIEGQYLILDNVNEVVEGELMRHGLQFEKIES